MNALALVAGDWFIFAFIAFFVLSAVLGFIKFVQAIRIMKKGEPPEEQFPQD